MVTRMPQQPFNADRQRETPMAKPAAIPILAERRHTVSIWLLLLGVVAFLAGCVLLFLEDAPGARSVLPSGKVARIVMSFTPASCGLGGMVAGIVVG